MLPPPPTHTHPPAAVAQRWVATRLMFMDASLDDHYEAEGLSAAAPPEQQVRLPGPGGGGGRGAQHAARAAGDTTWNV